jgi:hypothetical protein
MMKAQSSKLKAQKKFHNQSTNALSNSAAVELEPWDLELHLSFEL